jgi:transposase
MNSAERVERDRRIAAARATGDSVAAIARREGVSERSIELGRLVDEGLVA